MLRIVNKILKYSIKRCFIEYFNKNNQSNQNKRGKTELTKNEKFITCKTL